MISPVYKYINILFLLVVFFSEAQTSSNLLQGEKSQKISFKLINNLIIIPLNINGVTGNFILDTGVKGNILFLADEKDFKVRDSLKEILIRGFGYGKPTKAFLATGNTISYKKISIENKNFYLINNKGLSFSAKTGMTINGVIGADFFRNNIVKIDYKNKRITVFDRSYFYKRKYKKNKMDSVSLVFHGGKPYLEASLKVLETDTIYTSVKLLIDTGGTDALWLFKDKTKFENLPTKFFTDFLGESLTGSLHGDKSRIETFSIGNFEFGNLVVSFLNDEVANRAKKIKGRNGTVGGGVLKRFTVWFDYQSHKMLLKKNSNYTKKFHYNMSGLEINYNGSIVAVEQQILNANSIVNGESTTTFSYEFVLKPTYVIANVRKGSPGYLAGLQKGDILLEINNKSVQEKSYGAIVEYFYTKKNKIIELRVMRNEEEKLFKFKLIDELD